jgi:hypothetical protein
MESPERQFREHKDRNLYLPTTAGAGYVDSEAVMANANWPFLRWRTAIGPPILE